MDDHFLEVHNLTFSFPNSKENFFNKLSVSFKSNQSIIGILGSNGCGKTLFAKILTGLEKNKEGTIKIFGENLEKLKTRNRLTFISMSFQLVNNTFLKHSIKDEIEYTKLMVTKIKKSENKQNIEDKEFLLPFRDKMDQHPLTLSGGEKRKLNFQLLRILNPQIYILDEPTVGLDYYALEELKNEISNLTKQNKKILIITHDIKFLLTLTDSVVIIDKNTISNTSAIIYQGSLRTYLMEHANSAEKTFSIPIEFKIYKNMINSNELDNKTTYNDFLKLFS